MSSYNNRLSQPIAFHQRSGGWVSRTKQQGSNRKTFLRGKVQRSLKWRPKAVVVVAKKSHWNPIKKRWEAPPLPVNPYREACHKVHPNGGHPHAKKVKQPTMKELVDLMEVLQ